MGQSISTHAAAIWTAALVLRRLREAHEVERRLPGERRFGIGTAWPNAVLHDFADRVHWLDERERVWKSWEHAKGAEAWEVSRMHEAFDWLPWVDEGERRCLVLWARTMACGIALAKALRYGRNKGWRKATFYRKVKSGSEKIARRLNYQGVRVR